MTTNNSSPPVANTPSAFPSTRWSMVINAGAADDRHTGANQALETLCRLYWYPLYAYARRQGRAHHEAEDCTQTFLAQLLASEGIARARPERGRFRTFLLTSFRYFLIKEWQRARTEKRGGEVSISSLEFTFADKTFAHEPVDPTLTPEEQFDRSWAMKMIETAINDLRNEYRANDQGELFEALGTVLWGREERDAFAAGADRAGLSVKTFRVALHRLRRRLGDRLRSHVAETVAAESDVDSELRHLIAVSGRR